MKRSLLLLPFLLSCATTSPQSPAPDARVSAALATIRPEAIRGHIEFLADDSVEGRETGTRGFDVASAYVASEFEEAGLEPGTPAGWFQPVTLRSAIIDKARSSMTIERDGVKETLGMGTDYALAADPGREDEDVEGAVVFVGYGVTAPDASYDDYANAPDVSGKIVLVIGDIPPKFDATQRAFYGDTLNKAKNAAARGAIGIMVMRTPTMQKRVPFARRAEAASRSAMTWVAPDGTPHVDIPNFHFLGSLSDSGAAKIFAGSSTSAEEIEKSLANGKPQPLELPVRVHVIRHSSGSNIVSRNVVGLLRGSDPKLTDEYLVISAHLDHLGVASSGDDRIFNGALDNASGVATIIEIARAMQHMPQRPRRSLLFVALTAEEKGELGSDFFAHFPPVPKSQIVGDINIDMFQMIFPIADYVSRGHEHSTMGIAVERAARELHATLSPDPEPEQVRFVRSDQYSFTKAGIPSMIIKAGFQSADPTINGPEKMKEWTAKIYHTPADDTKQNIDYPSGVRFTQLNALVAWYVANADQRPKWNPGDFFGERFGNSMRNEQ